MQAETLEMWLPVVAHNTPKLAATIFVLVIITVLYYSILDLYMYHPPKSHRLRLCKILSRAWYNTVDPMHDERTIFKTVLAAVIDIWGKI